jgi:hypothetical protein
MFPNSITFPAGTSTQWSPPFGVNKVKFTVVGGKGGSHSSSKKGGYGAIVQAILFSTSTKFNFTIYVGNNGKDTFDGYNNDGGGGISSDPNNIFSGGKGGINYGGGGGSASVVYLSNNQFNIIDNSPTIVAGGGGGAGILSSGGNGNGNVNYTDGRGGDGLSYKDPLNGNIISGGAGGLNVFDITNTQGEANINIYGSGGGGGCSGGRKGVNYNINNKTTGAGAGGSYVNDTYRIDKMINPFLTDTTGVPKIIIEW